MFHRNRLIGSVGLCVAVFAAGAAAQRRRGPPAHPPAAPPAQQIHVATIHAAEANNMLQRMRVWLFAPPAGVSAYGLASLGQGHRIWALLPGCRQPNPDDPRDPCPVGRVTIDTIEGAGTVQNGEPQNVTTSADSRRVQAFVVPPSVTTVRIRLLRPNNAVRYEVAIRTMDVPHLPEPAGHATPGGFEIDLSAYLSN